MSEYSDLVVWKKSIVFVRDVYGLSKKFPKEEVYGLTSQLRRSAVSIPSNIAEGFGRISIKERIEFLFYSLGSVNEAETQLYIAQELAYMSVKESELLRGELKEIRNMLRALIASIKKPK